jgi:hypothetical protein
MPDTVMRFRDRRVSLVTALAIMAVVLSALIVVFAYGNDYASCARTAHTRESINRFVAAVRERSAEGADDFRKQIAGLDLKSGTDSAKLAVGVLGYLNRQYESDTAAARSYRSANKDGGPQQVVPDCAQFPPPV